MMQELVPDSKYNIKPAGITGHEKTVVRHEKPEESRHGMEKVFAAWRPLHRGPTDLGFFGYGVAWLVFWLYLFFLGSQLIGCFWLLLAALAASGCFWLPLDASGCLWLLLPASGTHTHTYLHAHTHTHIRSRCI